MNETQETQLKTFAVGFVADLKDLGIPEESALLLVRKACSSLLATMPELAINEHNAIAIAVLIATAVYACYHPGRDFVVSRLVGD